MLHDLTLPYLRQAYGTGLSPAEIVAQIYERIDAVADPAIFLALRPRDAVLAEAASLGAYDPAKPLWGVPFAVKDNIDVAGMPTTAACPAYAYTPETDAFVVARLRDAGALVIGKTNLDQFATGLVGVRSPYGVPKNALDPAIVPGGSSSGSAVAVAQGIVSFALGTDTAGSGRVPAALNNIAGLKPSLGAWSARGAVPACRSVETISVFALTADDAYAVYQVGAVYDPEDAFAKPIPALDLAPPPDAPVIGVPTPKSRRFFGDTAQEAAFEASLAYLAETGATLEEIDLTPFYEVAALLYAGPWVAERYTVIADLLARDPEAILPVTRQIITAADHMSAADAFRGLYRVKELQRKIAPSLAGLDMLCVPSIPTFYSVQDLADDPLGPNANLGTYTNFVNLLDMCALAVPTVARSDGRPGSVTLLAPSGQDARLAAMAERFEHAGARTLGATGWAYPARPPRVYGANGANGAHRADGANGATPIVVCGAHMSGLPLNGDLTRLGATFDRETATASTYRFYALAGGPPKRPGLVRDVGGAEIAVEVWHMPTENLGAFLNTIPAPLGLGRVALCDGENALGFLCEAAGVEGAEEITSLGSWRSYLARSVNAGETGQSSAAGE